MLICHNTTGGFKSYVDALNFYIVQDMNYARFNIRATRESVLII